MKIARIVFILFGCILLFSACQPDADNDENEGNNISEDVPDNENEQDIIGEKHKKDGFYGTLWDGGGDMGVILSHGMGYDADSWKDQGKQLANQGMVAFANEDNRPEELIESANMLIDEHNVDEVALLGASAGGATAIEAVTEGDFDFSKAALLSPVGDAASIDDIPVLVIYGEEEGFDEIEDASVETLSIPGDAHAQEIFKEDDEGNKAMEKIIEFLSD